IQDDQGWLWMATDYGLNQFDGFETRSYFSNFSDRTTLSSNRLTCLSLGIGREIWVGTADQGLNQFDLDTRKATRYLPGTKEGANLPSATILALAMSHKNFLWIATDKGLCVMDLTTKRIKSAGGALASERISGVFVIGDNEVWVGTADGRVYRWNDEESRFKEVWKLNAPVGALNKDVRNVYWIGTMGAGLYKVSSVAGAKLTAVDTLAQDVSSITSDSNGNLWIGSHQGLIRFDIAEELFFEFQHIKGERNSLVGNMVTSVFEDRARMLWVTTKDKGTCRFHLDRYWFPYFGSDDPATELPDSSIWSIEKSFDGSLWVGTQRGLAKWGSIENRANQVSAWERVIGRPYIVSLLEDSKKQLWL
ncbi:MAG: two-component regulator propeller domain-containing protein, partial [Verrucomicrobiota bacterium]